MRWFFALPLLLACSSDDVSPTGTTTGTAGSTGAVTGTATAGGTTATPCSTQVLTLGEGEFSYEPREDGDDITLVRGPQGGWHIDLAGEVSGFGQLVDVLPSITHATLGSLAGEEQEEDAPLLLAGYDDKTCSGVFFKARSYVDDQPIPGTGDYLQVICPLRGEQADICLEATDVASGNSVSSCFVGIIQHDDWTINACAAL